MAFPLALSALGSAGSLLKGVSAKTWLYIGGGLLIWFKVIPVIKELLRDKRSVNEKGLDVVNDQKIVSTAKSVSRKMGTFPGQSWVQRYTEDGKVYSLLVPLNRTEFDKVADVYKTISRSKTSLRDDLHLYVNDAYLKRLKHFDI